MDERSIGGAGGRRRRGAGRSLAISGTRYSIVSEDATSCLIEAPEGIRLRGVADIYDGERHRAHCLVVLSRSEGRFLRVVYKRRTDARRTPPADFAPEARTGPPAASAGGLAPVWGADFVVRLAGDPADSPAAEPPPPHPRGFSSLRRPR